jgi:hypothetical protein
MTHGDRVQETTTTTGTGSLTLAGATSGHLTFSAEIGETDECVYLIELSTDPSIWEISKGTLTGTTLTRTLIKSSTGSLIDWAAGTKHVSQVLDAGTLNEFGTGGYDLLFEGTNTISQRNGTNPQTLEVYNTYTDASNYERFAIRWNSNTLDLETQAAGTGVKRPIRVYSASGVPLAINSNNQNNIDAIAISQGDGVVGISFNSPSFRIGSSATGKTVYKLVSTNTRMGFEVAGSSAGGTGTNAMFAFSGDTNASGGFKDIVRITAGATGADLLRCLNSSSAERFVVRENGNILMPDLPTSDPAVAGALWRSGNDLKISTG